MKKILLAVLIIILIPVVALCGEKTAQQSPAPVVKEKIQYGFQDIHFGTSRQEMEEALQKKYQISSSDKFFWISDFKLGDLNTTVFFSFDHNDKFYSFSFHTDSHTADKLDTTVKNNGAALTEIFKSKYGKPANCVDPNFFQIRSGYVTFVCRWDSKDADIYTAISTFEFKYYALATVTSKKMESAMIAHEKEEQSKKRKQGAKDF